MDTTGLNLEIPTSKNACSSIPCRIVVMIMCAILICAGLAFFVIGCLFTWAQSTVYSFMKDQVDAYLGTLGLVDTEAAKTILLNSMLEFTEPIGQIAFWIGLSVMAICSVGLYGAIIQNRFFLFLFASMLLAKILVLSVIIVAFHSNPTPVIETFRVLLVDAAKGYRSFKSLDKHSLLLNVMMPYLKCCGVTGAEDFSGAVEFDNRFIGIEGAFTIRYPVSCCKLKENYERLANKCPEVFDERNSNIKTGCWPIIERQVLSILTKVSFGVIFTILFEFILACFSMYATTNMEEPRDSRF